MSRLALLALASLLWVSTGCDSAESGLDSLPEPGSNAYALAFAGEEAATPLRAEGRAAYVVTPRTPEGAFPSAVLTLMPERPGSPSVRIALTLNSDGSLRYLAPGVYQARTVGSDPSIEAIVSGVTYSPYRGTVTIESVTEIEFIGQLDLDITTGGCAWYPTCNRPTQIGSLSARFRATAAVSTSL